MTILYLILGLILTLFIIFIIDIKIRKDKKSIIFGFALAYVFTFIIFLHFIIRKIW